MRYYSEETVIKIYENALIVGIDDAISKAKSIELPDKYGRLVDGDKLMKKVREEADFPSYEWCKAIECLEEAPTVVEASND